MQLYKIDKNKNIIFHEMIITIFEDISYFQQEQKKHTTNIPVLFRLQLLRTISWFEYLLNSYVTENSINTPDLIIYGKNLSNKQRFEQLQKVLKEYDINFRTDTVKGFITLINLRNYITHGNLSDAKKEELQTSFFNKNITEFNKIDIEKLNEISTAVLSSIFMLFIGKIIKYVNTEENKTELLHATMDNLSYKQLKQKLGVDLDFLKKIEEVKYMEDFFTLANIADGKKFKSFFQSQNPEKIKKYLNSFLISLVQK